MTSSIPIYLRDIPHPLPPPSSPIRESVADIVSRAHRKIALNWSKTANLSVLLRSYEKTVLYQGAIYVSEGDYVQGYLYLYMFAEFAITWVKQHSDRNKPQYKAQIQHVEKLCSNVVLGILQELKPIINESHEKFVAQQIKLAKRRQEIKAAPPAPPASLKAEQDKYSQRQDRYGRTHTTTKTQEGSSQEAREEEWDLLKQMEGIKFVSGRPQVSQAPEIPRTKLEWKYPSISQRVEQETGIKLPPSLPPKSPNADFAGPLPRPNIPEAIPPKVPLSDSLAPPTPAPTPPPVVDSGTRQFAIGSYLENGQDLRSVFIPSTLRSEFLTIAKENTSRNLETCGILCGVLRNNAFLITSLLIPPQTATSDSCTTTNESSIFDFQDKHGLLTLGWIHTHPTQTCFMSSVDLHTHLGYQIMLPEAIAIVCAPSKQPSWGVFRLTDPPGVKTITDCRERSLFHPHSVPGDMIYRDCWRGSSDGHVREMVGAKLEIVDLRNQS